MTIHKCRDNTWRVKKDGDVQCLLCSHVCEIKNGDIGKCKIRRNINGFLYLDNYGFIVADTVDTLKERPIHQFRNKTSLTVGLSGCSNKCSSYAASQFCSNRDVLQIGV